MAILIKQNKYRYKALVTITAGTPIFVYPRIANGAPAPRADRLLIQMQAGANAEMGLVYDDVPDGMNEAAVAAGGDFAVQLAPAPGATAPGGSYVWEGDIDLGAFAIDGDHTGDTVLVDAHLKI